MADEQNRKATGSFKSYASLDDWLAAQGQPVDVPPSREVWGAFFAMAQQADERIASLEETVAKLERENLHSVRPWAGWAGATMMSRKKDCQHERRTYRR